MIEVESLHFQYPGQDSSFSLRGICFCLQRGEKVALMGPNGSGKTTFVRCLNGLIVPDSGKVRIDELDTLDPDAKTEIRRRVGMVFQNPDNQIVSTTVEREIAFGLENIGMKPELMRPRVDEAMQRFHLSAYRLWPPHRLSGGERQRLALAAVWVMEPLYLVLDEPTSLLDPGGRREVLSMMDRESGEGMGILFITQFPEEAMNCDRLILMANGRIVRDGVPDTVFSDVSCLVRMGLRQPIDMLLSSYSRELMENRHER